MNKYIHMFLESPNPTVIMANDTQFVFSNVQKLSLPFQPKFVVTENGDPPFSRLISEPNKRYTYMGNQTEQSFLGMLGLNEQQLHVVIPEDTRMPPTIASDMAFLAALDLAVEQYGSTMQDDLKNNLKTFIINEVSKHNGINT